jgi:hypothetical protein
MLGIDLGNVNSVWKNGGKRYLAPDLIIKLAHRR